VAVSEGDWLALRFEEKRTHLRAVAYQMLGSLSDADDAVQETWLRLNRSDPNSIEKLGGWLTTVTARADRGAVPPGASRVVRGARTAAEQALRFWRIAGFAQPALVNGAAGLVAFAPMDGRFLSWASRSGAG
jgi:Sigma-70 region 2